jgi:hypothetical protein
MNCDLSPEGEANVALMGLAVGRSSAMRVLERSCANLPKRRASAGSWRPFAHVES